MEMKSAMELRLFKRRANHWDSNREMSNAQKDAWLSIQLVAVRSSDVSFHREIAFLLWHLQSKGRDYSLSVAVHRALWQVLIQRSCLFRSLISSLNRAIGYGGTYLVETFVLRRDDRDWWDLDPCWPINQIILLVISHLTYCTTVFQSHHKI